MQEHGHKSNIVLESQVEVVVADDGESVVDILGRWDGWDADDDGEWETWRGRKGMSLPRRDY